MEVNKRRKEVPSPYNIRKTKIKEKKIDNKDFVYLASRDIIYGNYFSEYCIYTNTIL